MAAHCINLLKLIGLCTSSGWLLWHVNYTSIKLVFLKSHSKAQAWKRPWETCRSKADHERQSALDSVPQNTDQLEPQEAPGSLWPRDLQTPRPRAAQRPLSSLPRAQHSCRQWHHSVCCARVILASHAVPHLHCQCCAFRTPKRCATDPWTSHFTSLGLSFLVCQCGTATCLSQG